MHTYVTKDRNHRVRCEEVPSRHSPGATYERRTTEIRCCGMWMECRHFTNTCAECGADYNMSGAKLAPRSQWGEETGESWMDCY